MSSISVIRDYVTYDHDNLDNVDLVNSTAHHGTSNTEEYRRKLIDKIESDQRNGNTSFLDSLENLRREHRMQLQRIERDYYNQVPTQSSDMPHVSRDAQVDTKQETIVKSKPPLPKTSKQLPSPVLFTEERARHRQYQRSLSANAVRRHDGETNFCPHRTCTGNGTAAVNEVTKSRLEKQLQRIWDEFDLDDCIEQKKTHQLSTAASWAGRITVPAPFALTNSMNLDNVHRRKCMRDIEVSKLRKEVEEELNLRYSFKANDVPAHVHMRLYEKLQEEQRIRREQVYQMTRDYLSSISKPFNFDAREKAKIIVRRHSYSAGDTIRSGFQFKAKPLPDFYNQLNQTEEKMKEQSIFRTIKKDKRAKDLLRQSRLPFTSPKSKKTNRSMSANDLTKAHYQEYSFKPKINGYYVPNYDKLHSKFLQQAEKQKRTRSPTKCKPFLLYTNLIPSKKDKVLDDMKKDAKVKHSKTFQIKGKQMPERSASLTNLSASFQKSEAIPTKTTEAQRLREEISKKKRQQNQQKNKEFESAQREKSVREKKVREVIHARGKLSDQANISKMRRNERARENRKFMRQSEDDYARKLDEMKDRLQQRPLLLEHDSKQKVLRELERKIKYAMSLANVTEQELIQYQQQLDTLNAQMATRGSVVSSS